MKQVSEIAIKAGNQAGWTKPARQSAEATQAARDEVIKFFMRMGKIYGQLWFKRYPDDAQAEEGMEEWLDTFRAARLTAKQVRNAMTECKLRYQFPPSHKEFVDLALGREKDFDGSTIVGTQAHRLFDRSKLLPHKMTDEERAKGTAALADLLKASK